MQWGLELGGWIIIVHEKLPRNWPRYALVLFTDMQSKWKDGLCDLFACENFIWAGSPLGFPIPPWAGTSPDHLGGWEVILWQGTTKFRALLWDRNLQARASNPLFFKSHPFSRAWVSQELSNFWRIFCTDKKCFFEKCFCIIGFKDLTQMSPCA